MSEIGYIDGLSLLTLIVGCVLTMLVAPITGSTNWFFVGMITIVFSGVQKNINDIMQLKEKIEQERVKRQ